jgi:hypothetical protein
MTVLSTFLRPSFAAFLALGLAATLTPGASAATITIQKVTCVKASESDGDELRMRISIDGKSPFTLSRTMRTGNVWTLDRKMDFTARVQVRLDEHDPLSPDETFGTNFTTAANGTGAWVFRGSGATYYVHYTVSGGNFGHILRLHSLKAVKTQESNGDDMFMKTYRDSGPAVRSGIKTMKPGQVWTLKTDLHFFKQAAVSFHEEDSPLNPDEQLGGLTVGPTPTGGLQTRTLSRNGMTYILTYEVIRKTGL